MRWKVLLLFILAIALAAQAEAAVIYGGKLFHGQNFTSDVGITYRIYGLNPYTYFDNDTEIKEQRYRKIAIVGDPDGSVYVFNNSCESSYLYKYCFIEHYLDLDNPLTFQEGNILSMISLSIETLPPPTTLIDITRNLTMETYCGQLITIPLSIYNEGSVPTNFTYKETFPPNTFVTIAEGGTINGNEVLFKERIQPNKTINYTFTITNFDCQPKNWTAEYSFTTYNDTIYRNITDISITVLNSYNITDSISPNKTNYPANKSYYILNFTNIHPTLPLHLNVEIYAPGLSATESSNGISTDGKVYRYNNFVTSGKTVNLYIAFTGKEYGTHKILNNATIKISDRSLKYNSTHELVITPPQVITYLEITNITNTSLNVDLYLRNDDVREKYYYLYGVLKGIDETEEPFYQNNIEPQTDMLIASKNYNITNIKGTLNVTFSGVYRDKNSVEHNIYSNKIVKITQGSIIVEETKQEQAIIPIVPADTPIQTPAANTNSTKIEEPKEDFVTRIINGLSEFLESIFS